jgi:tripartite-type tricarboxylate transporter receptor subunit TctC
MSVRLLALTLVGCLTAASASARTFPGKPITIVVPAAPGGVSDVMARLVAQRFTTAWNQQIAATWPWRAPGEAGRILQKPANDWEVS